MWKTSVWRRAPSPKGSSELPRAPPWARYLTRPQLAVRLLRPRAHPNCLARRHGLAILRGHSWRLGSFAQGLIRTASRSAMGSLSYAARVGGPPSPTSSSSRPPVRPAGRAVARGRDRGWGDAHGEDTPRVGLEHGEGVAAHPEAFPHEG